MSPLFFTVVIICVLAGAEVDLFIPSFPELQKVFDLSPFMVQLTLSANFVSYCLCSLFIGIMGDRYNRRHVMLGSLGIFVLGSIFCVFALNFPMLILGRFLQGAGMAGPAVLAFVVIADKYPIEKQSAMLGMLNGVVTLAMAFAPVVGSYVNLYFNWRGNFVILLGLGIAALIASYFVIPNRKADPTISLSLKSYGALLASKKLMMFVLTICFLASAFWTFIGMAPIVYMEGMGVNLKHFGFYQGAVAGAFSILSLLSPKLLASFGKKNCLYYSIILYVIGSVLLTAIMLLGIESPLMVTGVMIIYAVAAVFPVNILYPESLELIQNSKSRTAAIINSGRLLLTAAMLELVSYYYVGKFLPLGIAIIGMIVLGLLFIWAILRKEWISIE